MVTAGGMTIGEVANALKKQSPHHQVRSEYSMEGATAAKGHIR
jgi:hypothetical protein